MIQFRGLITEVAFRDDKDIITIKEGKRTSKIRVSAGAFEDFHVGETVTIVIEKEADMFGSAGPGDVDHGQSGDVDHGQAGGGGGVKSGE